MNRSDELLQKLDEMESDLAKLIKYKEKAVSKAPEGYLRISRKGSAIQYYHVQRNTGNTGKYLRRKNEALAKTLAQKSYDEKILRLIRPQLELISELRSNELFTKMEKLYTDQRMERRILIDPIWLPDDEFRERWEAQKGEALAFRADDESSFYTDKGERVRSKSEVIIANALHRNKIPYRYEYPLQLSNGKIVYPDFTVLNLKTRKEYIWEHFGMLDDPHYRETMLNKLDSYVEEGYFWGDNLIVTEESSRHALRMSMLDAIIKHYFK